GARWTGAGQWGVPPGRAPFEPDGPAGRSPALERGVLQRPPPDRTGGPGTAYVPLIRAPSRQPGSGAQAGEPLRVDAPEGNPDNVTRDYGNRALQRPLEMDLDHRADHHADAERGHQADDARS